ncbi:MAG: polyphenol oxidase family protein [Candidatus Binatia bacterium]
MKRAYKPLAKAPVLVPAGWGEQPGLSCGFGGRGGGAPPACVVARQVHGNRVLPADVFARGDGGLECDGLSLRSRGVVVAVRTADCVPVLFYARRCHGSSEELWAAAVHAGWRGTLSGVVERAVEVAERAGFEAGDLRAALGPSIRSCCYEVNGELAARFTEAGLSTSRLGRRWLLDLARINRDLLLRAGLNPDAVQICGPCTRCRHDLYHSYRANPSENDRQLSWVGWVDPAPGKDG